MSITERPQNLAERHEAAVLPAPLPNLEAVDLAQGAIARRELRCTTCGYGAIAQALPEQCPMCASTDWDFVDWRPFSSG
jgi:rubrerythrin